MWENASNLTENILQMGEIEIEMGEKISCNWARFFCSILLSLSAPLYPMTAQGLCDFVAGKGGRDPPPNHPRRQAATTPSKGQISGTSRQNIRGNFRYSAPRFELDKKSGQNPTISPRAGGGLVTYFGQANFDRSWIQVQVRVI